ncbi:MAG: hypothetical protein IKU17_05555, partial [Clostridia bacterium]|nr:hypothetical protein [Clostridia bacterium]
KGKEKFPAFNTVVLTLSFDAWCTDRERYLQNMNTAFTIVQEEGLQLIPRYFNSCFGTPAFGGYTAECVQEQMLPVYRRYMQESLALLADKDVLVHDISNEPLNNTYGSRPAQERIYRFIKEMYEEIKARDTRPVTVGTQGYIPEDDANMQQGWFVAKDHSSQESVVDDIAFFEEFLDVITIHPYNVDDLPAGEFERYLRRKLDHWEKMNKPVLITESCWGAIDEEGRKNFLESELSTYKKLGLGFCCHVLVTSRVADCFPFDERTPMQQGLYMAFLDENYEVRKYHDLFND